MQKRVSKPNKRWDDEPNSPPRRKQAKKQTKAQRAAAKKKQLADEAESERKRVAAAAKAAATEATRRAKELAAQERLRAKAAREAETARLRQEREDAKARKDREKEEQKAAKEAEKRKPAEKSATEAETKLAHMAQFLRHDLNISDAPTQAVFVDAVERKPGALFRATEPAALFGEELEARIHSWLTTARLAVLGGELIARVEDKLIESKALREMFDLCFPANIAEIVNVTPSQAEAMRRDLQARVVAKTMKQHLPYQ